MMFKVTPHRLLSCAHNAFAANANERKGERERRNKSIAKNGHERLNFSELLTMGRGLWLIESVHSRGIPLVFACCCWSFYLFFVCFTSFCHIKIADKYVNTNEYDGSTEELWVDEERSAAIWFQDIVVCFVLTVCGWFFFGLFVRLKCQLHTDRYDENCFFVSLRHTQKSEHRSACNLQIELRQAHQ